MIGLEGLAERGDEKVRKGRGRTGVARSLRSPSTTESELEDEEITEAFLLNAAREEIVPS